MTRLFRGSDYSFLESSGRKSQSPPPTGTTLRRKRALPTHENRTALGEARTLARSGAHHRSKKRDVRAITTTEEDLPAHSAALSCKSGTVEDYRNPDGYFRLRLLHQTLFACPDSNQICVGLEFHTFPAVKSTWDYSIGLWSAVRGGNWKATVRRLCPPRPYGTQLECFETCTPLLPEIARPEHQQHTKIASFHHTGRSTDCLEHLFLYLGYKGRGGQRARQQFRALLLEEVSLCLPETSSLSQAVNSSSKVGILCSNYSQTQSNTANCFRELPERSRRILL